MGEGIKMGAGGAGGFGKCVWQRGNYTPARTESIAFSYVSGNQAKLNVTGIPLSSLVGMIIMQTGTYEQLKIQSATQLGLYRGGSLAELYSYTYDENTGILTADSYDAFIEGREYPSKNIYYSEIFDILTHAVHNDITRYPNDGWGADGLYYRLLAAVSSANVARLSDYAVAAAQQDYRDAIETEVSNA